VRIEKNILVEEQEGKKGLERALESEIDLILLDVMLPGFSGIEVLR